MRVNPRRLALLASLWLILPLVLLAQQRKNELGFNIGGEFIPSTSLTAVSPALAPVAPNVDYTRSLSLELHYGRELKRFSRTDLWLDVPALVGPNHKIRSNSPQLPTSIATFYVTPGLRLAVPTHSPISPWASFGGGYALYETSDFLSGGRNNPTIHTNTGALQLGAGADIKTPLHILLPISARAEFRDFYTLTQPIYFASVANSSQHNLTVSGGLLIHF